MGALRAIGTRESLAALAALQVRDHASVSLGQGLQTASLNTVAAQEIEKIRRRVG